MSITLGFSSFLVFKNPITGKNKAGLLKVLSALKFECFDEIGRIYIPLDDYIKKNPEEVSFALKYKAAYAGLSCEDGDDYVIFWMDKEEKTAAMIISIVEKFLKVLPDIIFVLIDNAGDRPDNFRKKVMKLELKWLFKYNYFGSDFVEKLGADFFAQFPAERNEKITEKIFKISLVKDLSYEINEKLKKEILQYLKVFNLSIAFYDASKHAYR